MSIGLEKLQNFRNESGKRMYEAGFVVGHNAERTLVLIKSESSDMIYEVNFLGGSSVCECMDYNRMSKVVKCKHEMAARYFLEEELEE
jgi:hypothetical protein